MKSIQTSLQKWIDGNERFQQRYEQMKQQVLNHPHVQAFLKKHPEINERDINKRLNKLYEYTTQSIQCETCERFESCKNIVKGYYPVLEYVHGEIHLAYEKCANHLAHESEQKKNELIQSIYMPTEILRAKMADLYPDPNRLKATMAADQFISEAKKKLPSRGLFLSGPFGVGKTYLLGAIANQLQELGISSVIIYMPEFVREMREAIQDNTVQEKIEFFKRADVLMLDDIGAETLSAWFRDEVLGAILQYRMMERLPVFFTSNYTMEQLEQILATSTKNGVERVKAGRIMERIKQVSKEIAVGGLNRRDES